MFFGNKFMPEPQAWLLSEQTYWTEKVNIGDSIFYNIQWPLLFRHFHNLHLGAWR